MKLEIGLVAFQWLSAWSVVFVNQISKPKGDANATCRTQGYMSDTVLLFSLYIVLLASLTAVTTFIVLLYLNKRQYIATFLNRSLHTLSERYQLSENIKTTRLLYPVVTANAVCSFLSIGLMIFITVSDAKSEIAKMAVKISNNCFSLFLAVYAAIFPWLGAFGHPELQRAMKKMLLCCKRGKVSAEQPRNANGVELIMNQSGERSAHFAALQSAWNS
uniref:G-protein coupled receptors family 1 profile domain-containing protein n=1 Tax=Plectus sambesii TaxID=2011161 RepID=A0A914XF69_9BILA